MRKRNYKVYLQDIMENMDIAENFLEGMSLEKLTKDKKTVYAVVRSIEIIGEATKHIPDSIRKKYPEIPWKRMAGMRDKVIHEYFGVNLEVVWRTLKEEIPPIKVLIKKVLAQLKEID
jgi:uncharacterized protein with HEPN domain